MVSVILGWTVGWMVRSKVVSMVGRKVRSRVGWIWGRMVRARMGQMVGPKVGPEVETRMRADGGDGARERR